MNTFDNDPQLISPTLIDYEQCASKSSNLFLKFIFPKIYQHLICCLICFLQYKYNIFTSDPKTTYYYIVAACVVIFVSSNILVCVYRKKSIGIGSGVAFHVLYSICISFIAMEIDALTNYQIQCHKLFLNLFIISLITSVCLLLFSQCEKFALYFFLLFSSCLSFLWILIDNNFNNNIIQLSITGGIVLYYIIICLCMSNNNIKNHLYFYTAIRSIYFIFFPFIVLVYSLTVALVIGIITGGKGGDCECQGGESCINFLLF